MNFIKRASNTAILAWFFVSFTSMLHGEQTTRIVILQVPVKEAVTVRTGLNDPAKRSKPETMDAVLKLPGVTELAGFKQANPWRSEPVKLSKALGSIKSDGEVLELGVSLGIEGTGAPEVLYNAEITLPTAGKGARYFQAIGTTAIRQPAAWHERACWGDGKEVLMLWEYPELGNDSKKPSVERSASVQVEMRWFQTSEADVAKLTESKPDTREKALQWLTGRAKLWREAGYGLKAGNPCIWQTSQGKHDPERGASISDVSFVVQTECREEAGKLKMNWSISSSKEKDVQTTTLKVEVTPGTWEFIRLEGNSDANVIACRVTKL